MIKQQVKWFLQSLAMAVITPLLLSYAVLGLLSSKDKSLETHSQLLSLIPGTIGNLLRVAFYRHALDYCDPSATISFGTLFSKTGARIGKHSYVGPYCMIGLVTIGDNCLIGPMVQIPSGPLTHGIKQVDVPIRHQPGSLKRITVSDDCWIGAQSVILADVNAHSVIGAASVVTKSIPRNSIAVGQPCKVIRCRKAESADQHLSDTN